MVVPYPEAKALGIAMATPAFLFIGMSGKIFPIIEPWLTKYDSTSIHDRVRKLKVCKGIFNQIYGGGDFVIVPHPNSPTSKQARIASWEYFFNESEK